MPQPEKAAVYCKAPSGYSTTPFPSQFASHRTSVNQMQSVHCPGQRTHRPVPHRASARDLIYCHIRLHNTPPETMVQLCLVIQGFELLIWAHSCHGLLHRAKCRNKFLCGEWCFRTNCCFNPYQTILGGKFSHSWSFPLKLMCVSFFFVQYRLCFWTPSRLHFCLFCMSCGKISIHAMEKISWSRRVHLMVSFNS